MPQHFMLILMGQFVSRDWVGVLQHSLHLIPDGGNWTLPPPPPPLKEETGPPPPHPPPTGGNWTPLSATPTSSPSKTVEDCSRLVIGFT